MSEKPWSPKDPTEIKDYVFDWTNVLQGDLINSSAWNIVSGSATIGTPGSAFTSTTTTVWVAGGVASSTTILRNVITTTGGRTYERSRPLKIKSL